MSMQSHSMPGMQMSGKMEQCIRECERCEDTCLQTVQHCLQMGGEHAAPDHIRLMVDCAEICQTSAHFMLRGSPFHTRTCAACAEVCDLCAEDCERFGDDEMMRICAQACRSCANSCREMVGM